MSISMVIVLVLGAGLAIVGAGTAAAAETAFTRVSRSRAHALAAAEAEDHADDDDVDERVQHLERFARRPLATLAALTLVSLASQAISVVCLWAAGNEIGDSGGGIVGALVAAVLLFSITVLARSRSLLNPDATAVRVVPFLRAVTPLGWLTRGIVRLAWSSSRRIEHDPDVDEQQLLAIVEETSAIDHDEEALIRRVVAFDDTVVGSIMTPRTDMVTLRSGFAVRDALEVASLHGLSRIPVTSSDSEPDDVIGAVHVKDLVVASLDSRTHHDIDLWMREVPVVPTSQRIANLLADLKTSDMHLAIVIDEHGGVAGVVTLEDILEELVGEIEDEFDQPEPEVRLIDDFTVRVDGRTEISRINETLGCHITGDFRTIAGCFFSGFGRVPEVGAVVGLDEPQLALEVLRMHGRRIADIEVRFARPLATTLVQVDTEPEATVG